MIAEYHLGDRVIDEMRVTEDSSGALVGVAGFSLAPAEYPGSQTRQDYAYVAVVGISEKFRGIPQSGQRLGDVLLTDALSRIDDRWGDQILGVLAQVDPNNEDGRKLAERHDFKRFIDGRGPQFDSWYIRPTAP